MSTLGIFNTSNFDERNHEVQPSFAKSLMMRYPNGTAPMLAMTSYLTSGEVDHWRHHYEYQDFWIPKVMLDAGVAAQSPGAQAQITVVSSDNIIPGAILQNLRTNEQVRVQAVPSEKTMILQRAFGVIPPQAMVAGDTLVQIGTSYEESSLRPLSKSEGVKSDSNITQIFRDTWAVSGTAAEIMTRRGEKIGAKSKREAAMRHAADIERSIIFGQEHMSTLNGQPIRTMDGLISKIHKRAPQNIHVAPAMLSYDRFQEMLNPVFNISTDSTNSNDRLLITGNAGLSLINKMGRISGTININPGQTKFGFQFREFVTDLGSFKVITHPLFNTNAEWSRMVLVTDLSSMGVAYLRNRRTHHRAFNQDLNRETSSTDDNGIDAQGGTFLTEMTVEVKAPDANGIIYGLCDVGCDPCVPVGQTFMALLSISHPCRDGSVAPGASVTLTVSGGKPNTTVKIVGSEGEISIQLDANGNGMKPVTIPSVGVFTYAVVQQADQMNVIWQSPLVTACAKDCETPFGNPINTTVEPDSKCDIAG